MGGAVLSVFLRCWIGGAHVQSLVDRSTGAAQRLIITTPQPGTCTTPQRVPWSAHNTHSSPTKTNPSQIPKNSTLLRVVGKSGWAHLLGIVLSEAHGDKAFECGGGLLRKHGAICDHSGRS
jgi:hypothetical protein